MATIHSSYSGTRGGKIMWKRAITELKPGNWALMQRMRTNRSVIATQKGYLGITPIWAKVGDKVCVLVGGSVPLILISHNVEEGTHQFVGECYVNGIMDGEALRSIWYKNEEAELQEFVLV